MNLEVRTQTHKPDQTNINIYRFDMAKSAAQLLYGPVLVYDDFKLFGQLISAVFLFPLQRNVFLSPLTCNCAEVSGLYRAAAAKYFDCSKLLSADSAPPHRSQLNHCAAVMHSLIAR